MSKSTNLTVNLNARSVAALEQAAAINEDNRTDTVNQALQLYAYLVKERAKGHMIYIAKPERNGLTFYHMNWGVGGDDADTS